MLSRAAALKSCSCKKDIAMENRILRSENIVHARIPRSSEELGLIDFRKRVEKILAEAQIEAKRLERNGFEDGYRKGFAEGKGEGLKQVATIFHLAESIVKAREILAGELAVELAKIATMAAERVIEQEIKTRQEIIIDLIKRLAKELAERDHLKIIINPTDFDIIRSADIVCPASCEFVPNPSIEPGGCEIELAGETIDARLKTRVKQLWRAIANAKVH